MEFTREIYWNVGHGVLVPMYLATALSFGFIVYSFLKRIRVYRLAQSSPRRTDRFLSRAAEAIVYALGQGKIMRGSIAGKAHALFFWGFVLLFIGTLLIFIQADFTDPLFGYRFLTGWFYKIFSVVLDTAGLMAIVMMTALFVRRYLFRPEGLETSLDDAIMHGLLFIILVTGFMVEGARMAVTEVGINDELARWSPVGLLVAKWFDGMDNNALRSLHSVTWWIHFAFVIGFIIAIPLTKFRHIFTSSLNYLFTDHSAAGGISTPDLDDEEAESFGAATVRELTWKDIFDADACTLCARCQNRCPAHQTEKPLSPMDVVTKIGTTAFGNPDVNLIEVIGRDALWACTTCKACQDICPASVEHLPKIIEMRRHMALMEGAWPGDEVATAMDSIEVNGNPLGMAPAARGEWKSGISNIVTVSEGTTADILFFVGCYASYDSRNIKVARSLAKICEAAGVTLGILGKHERCCGEPARKLGNEYLYQQMATHNIDAMMSSGASKVVTACPHCFHTLANDYRHFGFTLEVESHTVFLKRLLDDGRLSLKPQAFNATYHDSCYLGRWNGIYDAPRDIIKAAGGAITEMEAHGRDSFCCGAGGGRIIAEEKLGTRINTERVRMAAQTGAPTLVSNCPFCLSMLEDGVKTEGLEESITPMDVAEIIAERLY